MSSAANADAAVPHGWDPEEWAAFSSWEPSKEEKVTVKGTILDAVYHKPKETIAVLLRTPNGQARGAYLTKQQFLFGDGRTHLDVPKEESDQQMEKLTELFLRKKGKSIEIEMYKPQY